jgi:hypothetical protein
MKSVRNEGYYTPEAETTVRQHLAFHCSGMNETSDVALHSHALYAVHVWLKAFSNELYFTLEAEKFFVRVSPFIGAGTMKHQNFTPHACTKRSASLVEIGHGRRYLTIEAATAFRPYLAFHFIRTSETSNVTLHTLELYAMQVWLKSMSNEGYLAREAETVSAPSRLSLERDE